MVRATLEDVVKLVGEQPRLPMVASQLLALFKDRQAGNADIKRVLAYDPEFASKVVLVAHGLAERSERKVNDLNMAVNFLGFETLKSIVILVGLMKALPEKEGAARFQTNRFWRHALAAGITYRFLARNEGVDADLAFLCGALHDIGKLVLNNTLPREMEQMLIMAERTNSYVHKIESLVLDTHHGEVGAWISESWGVSEEVVYFICHHHNESHSSQLIFVLSALADHVLYELGLTSPGSYGESIFDEKLWAHLQLKPSDLRQAIRQLKTELLVVNHVFPEQDP